MTTLAAITCHASPWLQDRSDTQGDDLSLNPKVLTWSSLLKEVLDGLLGIGSLEEAGVFG